MKGTIVDLSTLDLSEVVAHGGAGRILFRRVFEKVSLESACNFVDYAIVPPGCSIGRHQHGDDEELYLVLEGTGVMFLDGAEHRVGPGSVILNRPGGVHGLRNDGQVPLRIFVVEIAAPRRVAGLPAGHA